MKFKRVGQSIWGLRAPPPAPVHPEVQAVAQDRPKPEVVIPGQLISCRDLIDRIVRPVTVNMMGDLLEARGYVRTPHLYLDETRVIGRSRTLLHDDLAQRVVDARTIALFSIRNATVFGQGSVLIAGRHLLHDSAAEFINHGLVPEGATLRDGLYHPVSPAPARRITGATLLVKRPWYRNYGHWLVDLLPLLPLMRSSGLTVDTVIFGEIPGGNIRAMMDAAVRHYLPGTDVQYMNDADVLSCEVLFYVQPVHVPPLFKHPGAIDASADALRVLYPARQPSAARRIYVSREKTTMRRVINEEALTALLGRHGFTTIHPEELTTAEQIAVFEGAEHVVAVKGAALTTALVGQPGLHVLVLSPIDFVDSFFWDLCTQRGHHYAEIFCETASSSPDSHAAHVDLRADLDSLSRYLRLIGI